jgi:7-carboxy-7-deazaguanine synthase (Cx14CxxC type)
MLSSSLDKNERLEGSDSERRTSYAVKSIYLTIQGEGEHTGRAAVFLRFSGCNLWSGREEDRAAAVCRFCDTDFRGTNGRGGGVYKSAEDLAEVVDALWQADEEDSKYVVCTGGEPLLQLDEELIEALQGHGFHVAVETNGTRPAPAGLDWICVSPKPGPELKVTSGHELKLVFPQEGVDPTDYEHLDFQHFWLQPMDCADFERNTRLAMEYCLRHPRWKLSLQTHKYLGID